PRARRLHGKARARMARVTGGGDDLTLLGIRDSGFGIRRMMASCRFVSSAFRRARRRLTTNPESRIPNPESRSRRPPLTPSALDPKLRRQEGSMNVRRLFGVLILVCGFASAAHAQSAI